MTQLGGILIKQGGIDADDSHRNVKRPKQISSTKLHETLVTLLQNKTPSKGLKWFYLYTFARSEMVLPLG